MFKIEFDPEETKRHQEIHRQRQIESMEKLQEEGMPRYAWLGVAVGIVFFVVCILINKISFIDLWVPFLFLPLVRVFYIKSSKKKLEIMKADPSVTLGSLDFPPGSAKRIVGTVFVFCIALAAFIYLAIRNNW